MSRLPLYLIWFGRLRKNTAFQEINSKLNATENGQRKIYPVLCLRFWCHAHLYFPVFPLILSYLIGDHENQKAWTLLMVSLGSLSFALWDSYGGVYADKNGCKSAINLGIKLMVVLMVLFGAITLFNKQLGSIAIMLAVMGQLLVGIPLALIDGADTVLTRKVAGQLKVLSQDDGDHLEGICTQLKYSGLALASFVGCLLYVTLHTKSTASPALVGTILFLLTAASQVIALWQLRRIEELDTLQQDIAGATAERVEGQETSFSLFRSALSAIYADKVLATWVLILAVTEGWLLFAATYFQLDALKSLMETAKQFSIFIFIVPITYWFLSAVAAFGGAYFNRWNKKAAAARNEDNQIVKLSGDTSLKVPHTRLIAAGGILAIMFGIFVLHLAISAFSPQSNSQREHRVYWLSLVSLLFFAIYQFLRGFAHPLLKTTINNMTTDRPLQNPTTILSCATAAGRFFHSISALLFLVCWIWAGTRNPADNQIPTSIEALAGTVMIIVLTIVVLNIFFGVALDRKHSKADETPRLSPLKQIRVSFDARAFRSTVIKGAFFVCLAMSNILAPKLATVGFLVFNAGAIPYALTFMLVDTIAETEGKTSSRQLWLAGICTYFVVGLLIFVAVRLPAGQSQELQILFDKLFGNDPNSFVKAFDALFQSGVLRFILASLCSFTAAQYLDIWLFLLLKRVTRGKALWLRNNLSTFIAQTVDTIIFIFVGFWPLSFSRLITLVIGQLAVKWIFSLMSTPLLYSAVWWIEKGKESDLAQAATS